MFDVDKSTTKYQDASCQKLQKLFLNLLNPAQKTVRSFFRTCYYLLE